jgi:hypothetical protein
VLANRARTPIIAKVRRHPKACPITALSGTPNATAIVVPAVTVASAFPRLAGSTTTPARAWAFGM